MHNATKAVSFLLKVTSFLKLVVEKLLILMLHFEGYLPTLSPFFPAKEIVLAGTAVFVLAFFFFSWGAAFHLLHFIFLPHFNLPVY